MTDPEVHAKLDALTDQVTAPAGVLGGSAEPVEARRAAMPDRLTAADVTRAGFAMTRLASGYSVEQVDAFLDRVAEEIATLTAERDEARRERDALS
ncbi:DivIVA domain-containing protein [Actinomadura meyerae]|uniref:DivIVA domain-containing protein n=1 Tax=Actinomadura meyerae TaxID=240840 RepID=A0A239GXF9_9ACTN|nr:DivIVA domain-containing protein [Actinomadura meyerae]SNS73193.1 DivIVA domain-containing protein [Actinomadura meyerae]